MSTLLLRSAGAALQRSIRHRPSLPLPIVENPRLFSSGVSGRKPPNKQQDEKIHILKHMKILTEDEKELRSALARTREETKHVLEKHSRLQQELELRDKRSAKYESLKQIMMWTAASFFVFFALDKTREA